MHLKSKKVIIVFCEKMMPFFNSVLDLYKDGEKYLKAMQNYASTMQTVCKYYAKRCQAKKRKAKKRKAKQIKQKQTKIIFKFVCEF